MTLLMRISLVLMLSTTTLGVFASQADEDKATIEEIIIAIENGWESGQGRPFYEHYLDHKGALAAGQIVGGTDARENAIDNANLGATGRYEAADLRHQHD